LKLNLPVGVPGENQDGDERTEDEKLQNTTSQPVPDEKRIQLEIHQRPQ
jgi:hypothetical protein